MCNSRENVWVVDQQNGTEIGYWLSVQFVNANQIILWVKSDAFFVCVCVSENGSCVEIENYDLIGDVPTINFHSLKQNVSQPSIN